MENLVLKVKDQNQEFMFYFISYIYVLNIHDPKLLLNFNNNIN